MNNLLRNISLQLQFQLGQIIIFIASLANIFYFRCGEPFLELRLVRWRPSKEMFPESDSADSVFFSTKVCVRTRDRLLIMVLTRYLIFRQHGYPQRPQRGEARPNIS